MKGKVKQQIQALVDLETRGWDMKNPDLFLSKTKEDFPWKGRVCKIYTRMPTGDWKFIFQTGALNYSKITIG